MSTARPTNWDVIVVGTGPGGATVARDLARSGKRSRVSIAAFPAAHPPIHAASARRSKAQRQATVGRAADRTVDCLPRPVMMTIWSQPEAMASSTPYWMMGLSTIGSISLGWALVAGR